MKENNYGHYIVQSLHEPDSITSEFRELYKKFATRILWIDSDVVPGAFQMNTSWYNAVPPKDPIFEEHSHEYEELIGFFGSDPDEPYKLNAEVEITLNGESHLLTVSSLIFVPTNLKHTLRILKVDKPVFHFSVVMNSTYNGEAIYKVD